MNRDIQHKIIGLGHFLFISGVSIYSTIYRKTKYDMYVLLLIFGIILTWTVHNGECVITEYVKRNASNNTEDMLFLFGGNTIALDIFKSGVLILYLVSIWQLLLRNNYPIYACMWLSIVYIAYIFANQNHRTRSSAYGFSTIQNITSITYIVFGAYVIYRLATSRQ